MGFNVWDRVVHNDGAEGVVRQVLDEHTYVIEFDDGEIQAIGDDVLHAEAPATRYVQVLLTVTLDAVSGTDACDTVGELLSTVLPKHGLTVTNYETHDWGLIYEGVPGFISEADYSPDEL